MARLGRGHPQPPTVQRAPRLLPTASITDDFTAGIGPELPTLTLATAVGGRLRLPCDAGYSSASSAPGYALAGSYVHVQVPTLPNPVAASGQAVLQIIGVDFDNRVELIAELQGGVRTLVARHVIATVQSEAQVTYSATDHQWWRIRAGAGTVDWETSPDGLTWTSMRTLTSALNLTQVSVALVCGHWNTETGDLGYAEFDNLNLAAAPGALTGQGSAQLAFPATGQGVAQHAGPTAARLQTTATATATAAHSGPPAARAAFTATAAAARQASAPAAGRLVLSATVTGVARRGSTATAQLTATATATATARRGSAPTGQLAATAAAAAAAGGRRPGGG
ncbi:hypothetical protein MXD61_06775, partial [Frankia sp. AgPm24]